jgi:hypothetical protein
MGKTGFGNTKYGTDKKSNKWEIKNKPSRLIFFAHLALLQLP